MLVAFVRLRFAGVPSITTAELAAWMGDLSRARPVLLDARQVEEFAVSHLPGAVRVDPRGRGLEGVEGAGPGDPVVVYCSAGYRSAAVARRLIKSGAQPVWNLEGSIFAWANEGRPLEAGGMPAGVVHSFNRAGELLLRRGLAVRGGRRRGGV